jgi:anaerobic ribonucleoside-triphosphate reductase activating protein
MAELAVHAIEPRSRANGPGVRAVLWVQGCSLACPGCYNPATHPTARPSEPVDALIDRLAGLTGIEGVTISGGEPLEQPDAVLALCRGLRARTALSILIFSGFSRAEIEAQRCGPAILSTIDVLIDGRYRAPERLARGLRGSTNQQIHCLTDRYRPDQVAATPEAEVRIGPTGEVVITGVNPPVIK